MRKFIDLLGESAQEVLTNDAERNAAFEALADAQRGDPELAMVAAQHVLGGGVLSWAIEHVGDLTHRMAEHPEWIPNSGYEFVHPKVTKAVRLLSSPYGFEREFRENMRSNAAYAKEDVDTFFQRAAEKLKVYAEAHAKLPVYNRAQRLARDAAVHLGNLEFDKSLGCLMDLEEMLSSPQAWHAEASKYEPN